MLLQAARALPGLDAVLDATCGAVGATCALAGEILDYMEKVIYNNLVVEHLTGRIRRSVPTLTELRKTLEA